MFATGPTGHNEHYGRCRNPWNPDHITGGAVSGNWWKGTRLGTVEGYTVVSVHNGKLTTRYETYGFQSVEPENT